MALDGEQLRRGDILGDSIGLCWVMKFAAGRCHYERPNVPSSECIINT